MKHTDERLEKIVKEELQKEGLFDFFKKKKPAPTDAGTGGEVDPRLQQQAHQKAYDAAIKKTAYWMSQRGMWSTTGKFEPHPKLYKLIGHTWFPREIEANRPRPWTGNAAAWQETLKKTFPVGTKTSIEYLMDLGVKAEESGVADYQLPDDSREDEPLYQDVYGGGHGGRLASLSSMEESKTNDNMASLMEGWRKYEKKTLLSEETPRQRNLDLDTGSTTQQKGSAILTKKLKDASATKVVPMVTFLNSPEGKDPKVRAALGAGDADGTPGDEVIGVKPAAPAIKDLSPTQNEISLTKSIGWPLSSIDTLKNVKTGDPTGKGMKIVSAGNLVIDGHHRWSSIWSVNPKGKIQAVDMELPGASPLAKLATAQTAIAATIDPRSGNIPKATTGGEKDNILGAKEPAIAAMLKKLAQSGTTMESGLPILGDKYIEQVKKMPEGEAYFGLQPNMDNNQAREAIINRVASNLSNLPAPQGPERDYMPQFDGGDTHKGQVKLAKVVAKMKSGKVNYKAPFEE